MEHNSMRNWWLCIGIAMLLYVDVAVNAIARPYPPLLMVTPIACIVLMVLGHLLAFFPRRRVSIMMSLVCMMAVILVFHTLVHASFRYSLMQSCCNPRWSAPSTKLAIFNSMACAMAMTDCSYSIVASILHLGSLFLCLHGMVRASVFHLEVSIEHVHLEAAFRSYMDRLRYVHVPHHRAVGSTWE
ncbi:hypothetical protein H310_03752 [Aphanomyces invadans]|uniref:Uncharacterized protein n=1 Tax=Aphanomyces invadans TaxID=157072 RepID=A0A024UIZ8_9STRA|nr:hypothetical protein H310_03752 [Aphanomyces invadans]ETW06175.1 hypothetical protein H310_03752 [Aphanomyces invadans]|eukprot:XP_008865952.1 hypothetical protein H310_03752 [Aphanomyces invadans]